VLLHRPTNPAEALVADVTRTYEKRDAPMIMSDLEHSLVLTRIKPWVNACLGVIELTHIVCSYVSWDCSMWPRRDVFRQSSIPVPSIGCRAERRHRVIPHPQKFTIRAPMWWNTCEPLEQSTLNLRHTLSLLVINGINTNPWVRPTHILGGDYDGDAIIDAELYWGSSRPGASTVHGV
jgi:hypothetical protein